MKEHWTHGVGQNSHKIDMWCYWTPLARATVTLLASQYTGITVCPNRPAQQPQKIEDLGVSWMIELVLAAGPHRQNQWPVGLEPRGVAHSPPGSMSRKVAITREVPDLMMNR